VKRILAENYVRPDEAEKIKSKIREAGSYKVIDKVTVKLNEKRDTYEALLSNLGVKNAEIPTAMSASSRSCWWAASGALSRSAIASRKTRRARLS
jgi:predicted ATP-dependent Lon-type protease